MPSKYQLITPLVGSMHQAIKRVDDNSFIPFDEGNRDYQEYKQWLSEGNEPDQPEAIPITIQPDIPEPTPPPDELSPEQELAQKENN